MSSSSGSSSSPSRTSTATSTAAPTPAKASIFVTPVFRREVDKPSLGYVDISFVIDSPSSSAAQAPVGIDRRTIMTFNNFFVSHITIQQLEASGSYATMSVVENFAFSTLPLPLSLCLYLPFLPYKQSPSIVL